MVKSWDIDLFQQLAKNFFPNKEQIKFHVFGSCMKNMVVSKRHSAHVVPMNNRNNIAQKEEIEARILQQ